MATKTTTHMFGYREKMLVISSVVKEVDSEMSGLAVADVASSFDSIDVSQCNNKRATETGMPRFHGKAAAA
jgi:hypothetical protein